MMNILGWGWPAGLQAYLAQIEITFEDADPEPLPFGIISS
jgi:hypothetical protein